MFFTFCAMKILLFELIQNALTENCVGMIISPKLSSVFWKKMLSSKILIKSHETSQTIIPNTFRKIIYIFHLMLFKVELLVVEG